MLADARGLELSARLLTLSAPFKGTPYALSPLGEGEGYDADPLFRWDAVDCLTFVEETMALALTGDGDVVPTLNQVRYADGRPSYATRNHIMEAQWLPNNIARGFLTAVTSKYGAAKTRTVTKTLTEQSWHEKGAKALQLPPEAWSQGDFSLELIPSANVLAALSKAPSGLVVVVVRADRSWLITRVSHVGFLVQTAGGPMLRHASKSYRKVVDEPLGQYLSRNLDYGAWTIEGVALFEVTTP